MPRRLTAELAQLIVAPRRADGTTTRLEPPRNLTKTEAELFRYIVSSLEPRHFARSDTPLLGRYCKNLVLADTASEHLERDGAVTDKGKVSPWVTVAEKADRALAHLATKLRLCPSARIGPRDAQRRADNNRPLDYYERMELEREHYDAG
jgi:phage terminase small subunit